MACVQYIFQFAFIYQLLSSSTYCFGYQYLIYGWPHEGWILGMYPRQYTMKPITLLHQKDVCAEPTECLEIWGRCGQSLIQHLFWSAFASNTNKLRNGGIVPLPPPPNLPLFPPALKCVQSNPFYNAHHRKGGTTTPRKNTQLEICNRHAKHWNDDEKRYIFGAIKPWYMGEKKVLEISSWKLEL